MTLHLPSRYHIGREIGRGGMGVVYEADDERLGRKVAIKVLHSGAEGGERRRRFAQEARAASALNHPNIVTIHDIDAHEDVDFIVMELVDGVPLTRIVRDGAMPVAHVVDYGVQIASALAASHAANIVHRDVKPANIMVTGGGQIKVLDFGLSKWTGLVSDDAMTATAAPATRVGTVVGTSGYMSPEQALGQPVDARSDVFSLGVVLYELAAGRRAFSADSELGVMHALVHDQPKPLAEIRPDLPAALREIVDRCLQKDRLLRYPSAVELLDDLRRVAHPLRSTRQPAASRYIAAAAVVLLAVVVAIAWAAVRRWQSATIVERSIPEIERLAAAGKYIEAYRLAERATRVAPGDARVRRVLVAATAPLTLTEPAGADVFFKDYVDADGPWELLGRTPLKGVRVPQGQLRWRIVKSGFEPAEGSSPIGPFITVRPTGEAPPGMVYVRDGPVRIGSTVVELPAFWIDKYEATNREFKRFVDAGGYHDPKYWQEPFVVAGVTRSFDNAISLFSDKTGRPGPSTWELGTFLEGQADYPVSGVSWYEAAAYAEFAGKRLPTYVHWRQAIGNNLFGHIVAAMANFSGKSVVPPTALKDLGAFGTYGLAGNVKEWISNPIPTDDRRFLVGGAWSDPPYMAANREPRSSLDRAATNGFRCIRSTAPPPAAALAPVPIGGNVARFDKPVSAEVYAAYQPLYAYDRRPFDVRTESVEETEHYRTERISIDAAYAHERVPIYLFLPKNTPPPYQTVVWFPGSYVFGPFPSTGDLGMTPYFDFLPRTGRALVFPIYQGMFERFTGTSDYPPDDKMNAYRDMAIQWSKDLGRTLDYLETRPDFDMTKVGYYGVSAGADSALPIVAIETRFKAVVLLSGGLSAVRRPAEVDPLNFASHITAPTLMLNGRDDFIFPLETVARPLFALLGAPPDRKRLAIHEGGHIPALNELIRDVLGWYDRYLGPVGTK
jgi:dienelactone hydrolase